MLLQRFNWYIKCFIPILFLNSCLPGEDDVSARYNAINQRALIESSGIDLSRAAHSHMAYLTAKAMRRKNALGNTALTTTATVTAGNAMPVPPSWIKVVECSPFSVITYFTAPPKGIASLTASNGPMTWALGKRFGWESVGVQTTGGTQYPPKASDLNCHNKVGGDIVMGSPIFVLGFRYNTTALPDPMKTTQPVFTRDITIPCPAGTSGAVKRQQVCQLVFSDTETSHENTQIKLGAGGVVNDVQRLTKKWECTQDETAPPTPLTTEEIAAYCLDPANSITKQPDNTIVMDAESLKELLENNNPTGTYSFVCRSSANGNCIAEPYIPSERTFLRCDENIPPARFVINPTLPPTLTVNGDLQGDVGLTRDCGSQWTGSLEARYLARRCNLILINQDGQEENVSTAQTIYQIAYSGAKCSRDLVTTMNCPAGQGLDANKQLPVTRRMVMNEYMALDWTPTKNTPKAWNTSKPATKDSRAEVLATALARGYVVPDLTDAELAAASGNDGMWSEAIVDAMNRAKPGSASKDIIACNNSGNPCSNGSSSNNIDIWVDTGALQNGNYGGGRVVLVNRVCSGTGSCNPIMGLVQPMCNGICTDNGDIEILESSFEALLTSYLAKVDTPLPPENAIARLNPSVSLPLFNDANALCELASSSAKRLMIFGVFDESIDFDKVVQCPALPNQAFTSVRDMMDAAVDKYRSNGGDLFIFANHITLGNEGKPVYHLLNPSDFNETGLVSTTITNWLINPIPRPDPCTIVR